MMYFLVILIFVLLAGSFNACIIGGIVINGLKQEIKLLWNCIDNSRRRLTKLEEQSNVAYVETIEDIKFLRQKMVEIEIQVKLMSNKTKDSRNQSAPDH